jgi:translation initiation factor 2-alpha kinase 4
VLYHHLTCEQGRGAFGSVVKARNKIDNRIYAVKKIRLKTMQKDTKIFREVNALSRLSHRFIVRYYTTWVETSEIASAVASEDEGEEDGEEEEEEDEEEDGLTSVPGSSAGASVVVIGPVKKTKTRKRAANGLSRGRDAEDLFLGVGGFSIDLDDLDEISGSHSKSSFPSIHFSRSMTPESGESSGSGSGGTGSGRGSGSSDEAENADAESEGSLEEVNRRGHAGHLNSLFKKPLGKGAGVMGTVGAAAAALSGLVTPPPYVSRTLYIQMVSVHLSSNIWRGCNTSLGIRRAANVKGTC